MPCPGGDLNATAPTGLSAGTLGSGRPVQCFAGHPPHMADHGTSWTAPRLQTHPWCLSPGAAQSRTRRVCASPGSSPPRGHSREPSLEGSAGTLTESSCAWPPHPRRLGEATVVRKVQVRPENTAWSSGGGKRDEALEAGGPGHRGRGSSSRAECSDGQGQGQREAWQEAEQRGAGGGPCPRCLAGLALWSIGGQPLAVWSREGHVCLP